MLWLVCQCVFFNLPLLLVRSIECKKKYKRFKKVIELIICGKSVDTTTTISGGGAILCEKKNSLAVDARRGAPRLGFDEKGRLAAVEGERDLP